jgi:hypothetical protein
MKRQFEERPRAWALGLVGLFCGVLAAGCERRPTMASRSAAAYDEAVAKGLPVGSGHGGHDATSDKGHGDMEMPGATGAGEASPMAGMMNPSEAAGAGSRKGPVDHAQMGHSMPAGAAGSARGGMMDHSQMDHSAPAAPAGHAMAGMSHGATAQGTTAGHDHAALASSLPLETPQSSAEIARLAPAETLQQDELDRPAALSLAEAQKAGGKADHTGHGAHGAVEEAPPQPPSQEHQHEPPPPEALR